MAFSTSCRPSPLLHCRSSPLFLFAVIWLFRLPLSFPLPLLVCDRPATRLLSSDSLASSCVLTTSNWSSTGRDSIVLWRFKTCSRNAKFSARSREQSVSRLRMRIDWIEFVFASSRFCLKKRRLRASMDSADGWGAIGGSLRRAICADRYVEINYSIVDGRAVVVALLL